VLAGNNGLEVRGGGLQFQHPTAFRLRGALASARDCVAQAVGQVPGVWLEDKGLTITVHYRSVPAPQQRAVALAIRHCFATFANGLALRAGRKAIDIHPRCDWSKGDALRWIRAQLRWQEAVCLCVGDDRLDEPMFAANQDGINIRVGWSDRSGAGYWVRDPLELIGVFAHLARVSVPGAAAATVSAARL
jgi:trehalose 6-phosphate phosphatase